ncbi:hypothetical protein [Nocardia jiangxiensis]|uniref:hypothetical protein n=1 Tax=Nocardia jiangxiensis TaxID=282685 RepID=UPI0002D6487F|nr:hypothetical protein [Nocardia jiangxiensis]
MTDDEIDDRVDEWHNGAGLGMDLHEYLGWTWEQYQEWLEGRPKPITDPNDLGLTDVHDPMLCHGRACVMHNPLSHSMRDWPVVWRGRYEGFERICEHGVGHKDPSQFAYWQEIGEEWRGMHSCDGCCAE